MSGGTVGSRNFRDYNASAISTAISRENYGTLLAANDPKMQKFREAVYKMVSKWSMEDKIAILTEYGDASALPRNPTPEIVNKALTESLIIHLDPKDLKILYDDVIVTERKLMREVNTINKKIKKRRRFNTSSFEETFKKYAQGKKNAKKAALSSGEMDDSYKVPKWAQGILTKLQRELKDVLAGSTPIFNKVELTGVAMKMGIEIPEGTPFKQVVQWIINKTALYVALILGKGKANYANAFMDSEPFEDVLQYTSFSYITGKPSMSKGEWAYKVAAARRAKAAIKERAKMQNRRLSAKRSGFGNSWSSAARAIAANDTGVLADASYDQLIEIAGKYGINPAKLNVNKLKARIYAAMAVENREVGKLNAQRRRLANKGKNTRNIDDRILAHTSYSDRDILGGGGLGTQSGVPVVKLSQNGGINENLINMAVPVYIVGQGGGGVTPKGAASGLFNAPSAGGSSGGFKVGKAKGAQSKNELSTKEQQVYEYIAALPFAGASKSTGKVKSSWGGQTMKGVPHSVQEMYEQCMDYQYINKDAVSTIIQDLSNRGHTLSSQSEVYRWTIAWIWCLCTDRKGLAQLIKNQYRLTYRLKILVGRKRARLGRALLAGVTLGGSEAVLAGRATTAAIKKRFAGFKDPKKFEDLPDKSKQLYNALNKYGIETLKGLVRQMYKPDEAEKFFNAFNGKDEFKNALMALVANAKKDKILEQFIIYINKNTNPDFSKDETYQACKKAIRKLQKAKNFFTAMSRIFKGARSDFKTQEGEGQAGDANNPLENPGQRMPIPKIAWNSKEGYKVENIVEAVPVYIVNQYAKALDEMAEGDKSLVNIGSGAKVIGVQKFENTEIGHKYNGQLSQSGNYSPLSIGIGDKKDNNESGETSEGKGGSENTENSAAASVMAASTDKKLPEGSATEGKGGSENTENSAAASVMAAPTDKKLSNVSEDDDDSKESPDNLITEKKLLNRVVRDDFIGIAKGTVIPVFAVNNIFNETQFARYFSGIVKSIASAADNNLTLLSEIETSLGSFVLTAPMGVGGMVNPTALAFGIKNTVTQLVGAVMKTASDAMETMFTTASTGARITRMATGGRTTAITGDAAGSNIFKGGAKPELVSSDGDLDVVPLNKTGTESRQRVSRMSSEDRRNALATAISSHAVKFSYKFPSGITEITNEGEAIKVFNVKPGITDPISVGGAETTVAELLGGIYALLGQITQTSTTGTELLAAIAAKPVANISKSSNEGNSNPFAGGFPENLSSILEGA